MSTHKYGSSWAVREPRVSARLVSVIQVRLRNSTPAGGPLSVAEPAGPQRVSRLALALSKAGSVTGGLGARMALEAGHGRTAGPGRSAMAGAIVAVGGRGGPPVFRTGPPRRV